MESFLGSLAWRRQESWMEQNNRGRLDLQAITASRDENETASVLASDTCQPYYELKKFAVLLLAGRACGNFSQASALFTCAGWRREPISSGVPDSGVCPHDMLFGIASRPFG